jgi:DNA-binding response OmpR family regulator
MARILIIDDEIDVRAVMAKVLERAGHEVEIAESAPAGMSAFGLRGADLVITDVIMPGGNGVDLVKQLRDARFAGRIIAISGGGNLASAGYAPGAITTSAYLAAASKEGADAVLTKPFERQELVDLVNSLLAS